MLRRGRNALSVLMRHIVHQLSAGLDLDSATSFDCDSTPRQTFLGVIRVQGTLLSCQWLSQWPQSCGIR
eukprot:scaffold61313_cov56-Cyclotella_meneghiniana.AAC.3